MNPTYQWAALTLALADVEAADKMVAEIVEFTVDKTLATNLAALSMVTARLIHGECPPEQREIV